MAQTKPPVELGAMTYETWLLENPKLVDGGPIELQHDSDFDDDDAVILDSHHVNSEILPEHYAKNTIILGTYNEYSGFNIWVTPVGFDYLLMAHQKHPNGDFVTMDRRTFGNHPHFHELDLHKPGNGISPDTRRLVPPSLYSGMNSASLLDSFMTYYSIDDGHTEPIELPSKSGRQKGLDEF